MTVKKRSWKAEHLLQQVEAGPRDPGADLTLIERMRCWCNQALEQRGKVAGLAAVTRVAEVYAAMGAAERDAFFQMLAEELGPDAEEVDRAIQAYQQGGAGDHQAVIELALSLESPRMSLFRQFNTIPESIKFLVDLRAAVLRRMGRLPGLALMEFELRHILESWFNPGFLELRRLTWGSPAALLEKLVAYEAVHEIRSWSDLKRRLAADRACFAFIHPAMAEEPIIFVEVALVQGVAPEIQPLLEEPPPDDDQPPPDTAIFYSITNAQDGLRGIPFGNLLIKLVTARLRAEVPSLRTFATLSPLPRFRRDFLLPAVEDGTIRRFFTDHEAAALCSAAGTDELADAMTTFLGAGLWRSGYPLTDAARPGLMRAAAWYLCRSPAGGGPRCPVGHFHAANGATLARLNWLGDISARGIARSAGMMANYRYDLERYDRRQAEYDLRGQVPCDAAVAALLDQVPAEDA